MDILIYNKIKNAEIKQGLLDILRVKAEPVYSRPDLLIIHHENFHEIPEDVMLRLQEFLFTQELDVDDIIYVFYPQNDTNMGMWPLKRKGRKRIHRRVRSIIKR